MKAINTAKAIDVMTTAPKGFQALNAPKLNSVAVACNNITSIAQKAATVEGLTPFGHKINCKGGCIDTVILSGKVHSIESFITALLNSGLSVVATDKAKYSTDTLQAVMAKRVNDHIAWCSSTLNNSHGGYGSRLEKTGLYSERANLAGLLVELSTLISRQFSANYSKLYSNRNK